MGMGEYIANSKTAEGQPRKSDRPGRAGPIESGLALHGGGVCWVMASRVERLDGWLAGWLDYHAYLRTLAVGASSRREFEGILR